MSGFLPDLFSYTDCEWLRQTPFGMNAYRYSGCVIRESVGPFAVGDSVWKIVIDYDRFLVEFYATEGSHASDYTMTIKPTVMS